MSSMSSSQVPVPTVPHFCHWPGCSNKVLPAMWGCKKHWYMLPKVLRDAIRGSYMSGQEITKTPSPQYISIAQKVQQWIRKNYNVEQ